MKRSVATLSQSNVQVNIAVFCLGEKEKILMQREKPLMPLSADTLGTIVREDQQEPIGIVASFVK